MRIIMMKIIVLIEHFQADDKSCMCIIIITIIIIIIFTIALSGRSSDYPQFPDKNIEAQNGNYLPSY